MANRLRWEEGTEITLDDEVEAAAAGWGLNAVHVNRIGSLVALHVEAAFAADAAALVLTLPPQFRPDGQVLLGAVALPNAPSAAQSVERASIAANGQLSYFGDTSAGEPTGVIFEAVYTAAEQSP